MNLLPGYPETRSILFTPDDIRVLGGGLLYLTNEAKQNPGHADFIKRLRANPLVEELDVILAENENSLEESPLLEIPVLGGEDTEEETFAISVVVGILADAGRQHLNSDAQQRHATHLAQQSRESTRWDLQPERVAELGLC
jgi:hypothetical protein